MDGPADAAIAPALLSWAESVAGAPVASARVATAGQARLTAVLSFAGGAQAVLRHDTGAGALAATAYSLRHEAAAYRALAGAGLPIPRLIGESADGRTILVEKAEGKVAVAHEALPDLLTQLGRLHALDARRLDLDGSTTSGANDLDVWEGIYRARVTQPSPAVDLAFAILPDLQPAWAGRPAFCHGDPGAGNYLAQGDKVTALLDWELWHLGDPIDDLAWLSIRAPQYGLALDDFGALATRFWSPASGLSIDNERLVYWQAVGLARMLVMCLANSTQPRAGRERLIQMLVELSCEAQLIELLAQLTKTPLDRESPLSADDLLAAFPARELSETAEDVSETFLPAFAGSPNDPWLRRIRQTLRQIGESGAALARVHGRPEAAADLPALHRRSRARLAWLPRVAAVAKPLATFSPRRAADAA